MIQLASAHPVPIVVTSLFERLSPQSRAVVMSDRSMMPKVVAAMASADQGASTLGTEEAAPADDGALGASWNPLAHPLISQASEAVSGLVGAAKDALFGSDTPEESSKGQGEAAGNAIDDTAPASQPDAASKTLVTRPGTPIYEEPGGKAVILKTCTPVVVVDTRIDDASMKNGNNTEEMGKQEWSHIRSDDGVVDGWVKFGAVTIAGELSDEMASDEPIPMDALKDRASKAVAQIWNEKGGYIDANRGKLSRAVAVAVMKVESGGLGFTTTGDATIRFEVHKLFRNGEGLAVDWGKQNVEKFNQHFRPQKGAMEHEFNAQGSDSGGAWTRFHGSQTMEWAALDLAISLSDRETALRCISIGAGQVMGFNAPKLGYASATEMFDAMNGDAKANVGGIFGFIKANPDAAAALASGDYVGFAAEYNGKTYAADYGRIIAEAVTAFDALEAKYLSEPQA